MLRILHGTSVDFIKFWKRTTIITLAFILPAVVLIAVEGFHYSVEFTGGTLLQVAFHTPPHPDDLRSVVEQAGVAGAEIQRFGTDTEYQIRAQDRAQVAEQAAGANRISDVISAALKAHFPESKVVRTETVGPKVGGQLRQQAALAVLFSFIITLAYLAWRFEWRFGLATIIATGHDLIATLAFIKYMNLEISLIVMAGILTMIGYSMNDTIIIFDRVRENLKLYRKMSFRDVLNRSINEVLPRTVLTHGTVAVCLVALILIAGEVIRPFAWVMLFGVVTGTFSSIYVASPILLYVERRWPRPTGTKTGVARTTSSSRERSTARETV
ncbi:MAG TPA: protein translocase subunit SecF [Gemmatimonadaceae bacterium]|nr:protein translocase subunit SecF [Gemmatimonadaceae bacterium]